MENLREELERVDPNAHQAPVDIKVTDTVAVSVPNLEYLNYSSTPTKMKINNTGYTVTVSGKFDGDPPAISGGPLEGTYKLSQLHFHWGPNDGEGSEHTFEGRSTPLELHAVHVSQKYATQEEALLQRDGVAILAFVFISGSKHGGLEGVVRNFAEINKPHTSFKISPQPVTSLCTPFNADYFSYWGSVISPQCSHLIQWLVCRTPLQASPDQFAAFRGLLNVNEEPLLRNYRDTQSLQGRTVFHVSPGARDGFTLHCRPEQTSATSATGAEAEAAPDKSLLSVEQPCTSLGQAESQAVLAEGEGAPTPTIERTKSGRELERTASGRALERTPSGRVLEKTASGNVLEKTASGRFLGKTESGRELERTASGRALQKTPSGRALQKTASGHVLEETASGRFLGKTESGRELERTASGRVLEKTASGHVLEKTPSGRFLGKTESGRELEKTASGRRLEKTTSGRVLEKATGEEPEEVMERMGGVEDSRRPDAPAVELSPSGQELKKPSLEEPADETAAGAELEEARPTDLEGAPAAEAPVKTSERTPSGRLPSMGSRVVSFSKLTGPIKKCSGQEWPDTPFEGPDTASPIFLDTDESERLALPPLEFLGHFKTGVGLLLTNSGETVEISLLKATERPVLQGGPLKGRYILDSAHFHWMANEDASGGTHTINNARAEIECHLVHIHEDYKSKTEAMDHPNGLAVVSILHQVGGAECAAFQRLCKELPRITELYTQVEVPGLDLSYMEGVVKPHEYFLYPGRFFGREDGKALVWIVYSQPIGICCQNVTAFQNLKLSLDFRQHNTFPLGDRPLYAVVSGDAEEGVDEGQAAAESQPAAEGEADGEGQAPGVGPAEGDADGEGQPAEVGPGEGDADGEGQAPGVGPAEGDADGEGQAAGAGPAEGDADGEGQAAGAAPAEGDADGEGQAAGAAPAEGDADGEGQAAGAGPAEGDADGEGQAAGAGPAEGDAGDEGQADGEGPAEGDADGADEDVAVGELRRTASGRVNALSPDEWPNAVFESKQGVLMAPLDIQTSTIPSVAMPPLEYRGHFPGSALPVEMRNTGEAVDLIWKEGGAIPTLVGGPLSEEYILDSAHFHWAQNPDDVGAMHRINGKRCDVEFHMVHYKKSLKTRQEAMFKHDGLAVTSFLIQEVGGQEDENFNLLTDVLPKLQEVEATTELSVNLDWAKCRAGPYGYFTYPGSLFGANQGITVIWMVYPTPIKICCQHIARFYKLDCIETGRVHPLYEPLDRPLFHAINPDNCTS